MALSATFTANFASFYAAVDKADVKLKDFGAGADKVGGRLAKFADQFSGIKIIQEATLMAKAIEQIGGVSTLTEKELARLGATTNEAVAKMKLLGMDVPKNLQAIADKTKAASKAATDWHGSLTKVASAAGIAFSGGALLDRGITSVIAFGKEAIASAGRIKDMATQLGVSTDAVQGWTFAAEQAGASFDDIGQAVTQMNKRLAEGDESTVQALSDIGLKFADIRAMKPEDAFNAITHAIAAAGDAGKQTAASMDLFGKGGSRLLAMMKDGMEENIALAPKLSEATIEGLDKAEDAWKAFFQGLTVKTGTAIGWLQRMSEAAGMELGGKPTDLLNKVWKDTAALGDLGDLPSIAPGVKPPALAPIKSLTEAAKDLTVVQGELDRRTKAATEAAQKAEERYQSWKTEILTGVSPALKQLWADEKRLTDEHGANALQFSKLKVETNFFADSLKNVGTQYKNLLALPPLPPDFIKGIDTKAFDAMIAQQNTTRALAGGSFKLEDAPKKVRDYSAAMVVASQVTRSLGEVTSKAWRGILQGADGAIQMIFQYQTSMVAAMKSTEVATQSAAAAAQLLWAAVTMGASFAISTVANAIAKANVVRGEIKSLRAELVALGEVESGLPGAPSKGKYYDDDTIPALNKLLDESKARIAAVDVQIGMLTTATQRFGGAAPAALRPFIASLQESARLTEEQRALLEGMAATPTWQELERTATDYGIALEGLGAKFQQTKLGDLADQYYTDFQNLVDAGADANVVLAGMADEVQALLKNAMKFGTSLPAFMKPMLEDMVKMGLLTDDAGEKLEDLSAFNFTDSIESSFEKMRLILEDIRDLLAFSIPQAALATGSAVGGAIGFAGGASAGVVSGAAVGPSGPGAGGGTMTVVVEADGRAISRLVAPFIPGEVRRLGLGRS